MTRKRIGIGIAAMALASLVCAGGCGKTETKLPELRILSHSMTVHGFTGAEPQSSAVVIGRAQNTGDINMKFAVVAVKFLDKNKNLIATGSAVRGNLQPGEIWDFTVKTVGPDAWKIVSYDITGSAKQ